MGTVEILLHSGEITVIDADDWPLVKPYRWYALHTDRTTYAHTNRTVDGRSIPSNLLHRMLLNAKSGEFVDHKDHNGLNNRRTNLRACTQTQNNGNARLSRANTSGYRGVYWHKGCRKWCARIKVDYKYRTLGSFSDPWTAAQIYNTAATKIWGEFAYQNERIV